MLSLLLGKDGVSHSVLVHFLEVRQSPLLIGVQRVVQIVILRVSKEVAAKRIQNKITVTLGSPPLSVVLLLLILVNCLL
jgi:hypothetical protein